MVFISWIQASFVSSFQKNLSDRLFNKYMSQSYEFHLLRNSSSLIRNIVTEVGQLGGGAMAIIYLMIEVFVLLGISIVLLMYEPVGAFVVIMVFFLGGYSFNYFTQKRLISWGQDRIFHEGERFKHTQQGLDGVKEILVLGRVAEFMNSFSSHNKSLANNQKKRIFIGSLPRMWFELLTIFVITMLINKLRISFIIDKLYLF